MYNIIVFMKSIAIYCETTVGYLKEYLVRLMEQVERVHEIFHGTLVTRLMLGT